MSIHDIFAQVTEKHKNSSETSTILLNSGAQYNLAKTPHKPYSDDPTAIKHFLLSADIGGVLHNAKKESGSIIPAVFSTNTKTGDTTTLLQIATPKETPHKRPATPFTIVAAHPARMPEEIVHFDTETGLKIIPALPAVLTPYLVPGLKRQ